jgi:hypothetical protein
VSTSAEREVVDEPAAAGTIPSATGVGTGAVVALQQLQRTAGNRATVAWATRRLQRLAAELESDDDAVAYAKSLAPRAGRTSLTHETRRLFRYVVKYHAQSLWSTLGEKWTFDDYPFQDFTFACMPQRGGSGFLLGVGPAFIRRIGAGEMAAVVRELHAEVKRVRSPELSGPQPDVPALGSAVKAEIEKKIKQRDPQGALDLLVKTKIQDGTIDPALLEGGAMEYDPDLTSAHGISSMQFWDAVKERARPTAVRISPGAFSSVAYLYSVVMHEYQHVLQRQSRANQDTEDRLRAAGSKSTNEVRAYAWELLNAERTGVKELPDKVASIWASLVEEYGLLAAPERKQAASVVKQAQARAQAMVKGSGETLAPLP